MTSKETNPKDAVGVKKWRQYCTVPATVLWEVGVGMLEGARKYGRHNYRVAGVRASVYVDAAKGHIDQWWEGEDIDKDSSLSHITKAICSLVVLRDAMIQDMLTDDRPPKARLEAVRADLQKAVDEIFARYPEPLPAFVAEDFSHLAKITVDTRRVTAEEAGKAMVEYILNNFPSAEIHVKREIPAKESAFDKAFADVKTPWPEIGR